MSDRYTHAELADKVDWEGGIYEAITGYGIPSDCLPLDAPESVREAWARIEETSADADVIQEWLDQSFE